MAPTALVAPDEDGSSPVTAAIGLAVFLTFLLLATQVLLYLFTASVAQAAADDGATVGAGAAATAPLADARDRAVAVLGGLADEAAVRTVVRSGASGPVLEVAVELDLPSLLGRLPHTRIERSATALLEP